MGRKKVKTKRGRTDREKLDLFLERVGELSRIEAIKTGISYNATVNISWIGAMSSVQHKLEETPDKDLRSILGELRKFVAETSDIYLNRVNNIVYQHVQPADPRAAEYKAALVQMNRHWKDCLANGITALTINGIRVSPAHAWDAWINGHYLHDDMDYRAELKNLGGLSKEMHRAQFLEGVIVTLKYTHWLARNIAYFLQNDILDLPSSSPAA